MTFSEVLLFTCNIHKVRNMHFSTFNNSVIDHKFSFDAASLCGQWRKHKCHVRDNLLHDYAFFLFFFYKTHIPLM